MTLTFDARLSEAERRARLEKYYWSLSPAERAARFGPGIHPQAQTQSQSRRARYREKLHWDKVRRAELDYTRKLRAIARHVGDIIRAFPEGDPESANRITEYLRRYAYILRPWASATATRMITEVARRDELAWFKAAKQIGIALTQEIRETPIGDRFRRILDDQVELITSIPLKAAEDVQDVIQDFYVPGGRRYIGLVPEIVPRIKPELNLVGQKAVNRATLIARTETAKAQASLTQARAEYIGSTHYIWQTAMDADVRPAHKRLQGTTQAWNDPPIAEENGERHHPGQFPNCFTGETLAGPVDSVLTVFRSIYRGALVVFDVGETTMRVTPNHPILTARGWTAAGALTIEDDLVKIPLQCGDRVEDYVDEGLVSFEEMFEAFTPDRGRCQTLFVDNFYGDSVVDHKVEIVRPRQYLSLHGDTGVFQGTGNEVVTSANSGVVTRLPEGLRAQVSMSGVTSLADQSPPILRSSVLHADDVGFATGSPGDAGFLQYTSDRPAVTFEAFRQRQLALASLVTLNYLRVRNIRSEIYHGYVYTLETDIGFYNVTTAHAIAKNCRCFAEALIPEVIE